MTGRRAFLVGIVVPSTVVFCVQALVVISGWDFTIVSILAVVLAGWIVVAPICWGILVLLAKLSQRIDAYLQHLGQDRGCTAFFGVATLIGSARSSDSASAGGGASGGAGASGRW